MSFVRASVARGAFRAARPTRSSIIRPQYWQQIGRRGYASEGHGSSQSSSDLPWALGAVAVTLPTCWFLMSGEKAEHGHGDHGASHGKEHEEEHKEEPKDDGEEEKSEDSGSESEGKDADTPDTSDDEDDKSSGEGEGDAKKEDGGKEASEKPPASKPAGDSNTQSGKQEGLSNEDTKHSTDAGNSPDKSSKAPGTPETAKSKGTVDTSASEEKK